MILGIAYGIAWVIKIAIVLSMLLVCMVVIYVLASALVYNANDFISNVIDVSNGSRAAMIGDGEVWAKIGLMLRNETSMCYIFHVPGPGNNDLLLPKSQVKYFCYKHGGDSKAAQVGKVVTHVRIPRWLAEKKDLDYE